MKSILACPFIPVSFNIHSHRAAQGVIYADIIKHLGYEDITVSMSRPSVQGDLAKEENKTEDFNQYENLFMYHGNDRKQDSKDLNFFGGMKEFPHAYNIRNISYFKGKVYSIGYEMPNYSFMFKEKLRKHTTRHDINTVVKEFLEVDIQNLERMEKDSVVIDPFVKTWDNLCVGDSHAICMYRPGTNINSVPFKTLNGALNEGLDKFIRKDLNLRSVEFYFGNIDIRHHVCRLSNDEESLESIINNLCERYFEQVSNLNYERKVIYELLPIENPSRSIPQSGYYEKRPYWGSWNERNFARIYFNEKMAKLCKGSSVDFVEWIPLHFYNKAGELDFDVMERPKSVHLSRRSYPYWQGYEYNIDTKQPTLKFE